MKLWQSKVSTYDVLRHARRVLVQHVPQPLSGRAKGGRLKTLANKATPVVMVSSHRVRPVHMSRGKLLIFWTQIEHLMWRVLVASRIGGSVASGATHRASEAASAAALPA